MIHTLNLTYDPQEALAYFNELQEHHAFFKWDYIKDHNDVECLDPKNNLHGVSGWGLQTIFNDLSFPYHCDIDPHDEGFEYFKDTELVFGFVAKVFKKFSNPYRSFVLVYPPGCNLGAWLPSGPQHVKIIIPIVCNSNSSFTAHSTPLQVVNNVIPGNILMAEFDHEVSCRNDGDSDNVAIVFNVPYKYRDEILQMTGTL